MKYGYLSGRKKDLDKEYICQLKEVNDESKTFEEHYQLQKELYIWMSGVKDAAGITFNGDLYYIPLIDSGEMKGRPMCCGIFLDWKPNAT